MLSCSIIPQVKNKQGRLVDSKLFTDLLTITGNRESAKLAYLNTHTNQFKSWFGDWKNNPENSSKIVDENGEPLIVYHASLSNFDTFKTYSSYFTSSLEYAKKVKPVNNTIMSLFLNIRNPKIYDKDINFADIPFEETTLNNQKVINPNRRRSTEEIKGVDGMIGLDYGQEKGKTFVSFYPNQIKSIVNEGSFKPQNDNIYLQNRSQTTQTNNKELNTKLEGFLSKIGVTLKSVNAIKDENGNSIDAIAVGDLLNKSIEVVEGRAKVDTLPEEASHFFVEILKQNGSPLYKSMMDEIQQYDLFSDVLQDYSETYKNDLTKIKEEAVGKLIAQHIVGQFNQENKQQRAATWWNRVLQYIKSKLGLVNQGELHSAIYSANPFSQAAQNIFSNSIASNFEFSDDNDSGNEKMYQLTEPIRVEERIRDKYNLRLDNDGRYYRGDTVVKNRVSDRAASDKQKSQAQIQFEELQKQTGIAGHKDLLNIIQRTVAEREQKVSPSRKINTNEETYSTLERYVNQLFETIPTDARVITDTPIYDAKTDTGGTPNLIIVQPDGKVEIMQFTFTNTGKDKKISSGKEFIWSQQLQKYKDILKNSYGITKFGRLRNIPVEVNYKDGLLSSIRTGSTNFVENPELNPIPLSEELTGNDKLDRLISTLLIRRDELEKSRPTPSMTPIEVADFNEKKYKDLAKVTKAIRDIQLKQDIKQYVSIGLETVSELASTPINEYSIDRLNELQGIMQFYGKNMLDLVADKLSTMEETQRNEFNRLIAESQLYDTNIKAEIARRMIKDTGREDLTDPQKETGIWNRWMRTISQQQHPIIKAFWDLVKSSKAKARQDIIGLNDKIKSSIENLKKESGKSGTDLFDFMLQKQSNGKLSIIPKFDSEFYKKYSTLKDKLTSGTQAEKEAALNEIKKFTTFDKEAYEQGEKNLIETVNRQYRFDEFKDEKISERLLSYRRKYDSNFTGYSNNKNPFIKLNEDEKLYSTSYKAIQASPAKKEFYDLWMQHSKEFQSYIGQDLGGRFVWNIHNNLVDSIAENGFGAFTNMSSILDHLEARSGETLGMVDPNTGKPIYEIPAYYTDENKKYNSETGKYEYDTRNQSKDLGRVLSLVAAMAYNHKYMQEIESSSKSLELLMQNQEAVLVDNNGNEVKNKLTNQLAKVVGSVSTLEQFRDYMNYYIYGLRNKSGDYVFKVGDRNISALATFNLANKWFVGKALALNPVSIVSNIVGGNLNARMVGSSSRFYNNEQYTKAIYNLLPFRDKKSYTLLGYFDLVDGQNFRKGAEALSTNFLSQYLTYDHLLIGQEVGDKGIRNGVLLAMLQSHTYKDGRIIKSAEGDVSLMDYIDTEGKKVDFKDIPFETLETFRNKVQAVGDNILGNNSRDDIRAAGLVIQGRALLTFRNWIPRMIETRYGSLTHNEETDTYELGRYKTFFNGVVTKQFLPLALDAIQNFGVFGYGGKWGSATTNRAKELYAEHMAKNPNTKITEQEYIDLHLANVRANMMEMYVTALVIASIYAAAPDKDEKLENGSLRKWFAMQMDRNLSELTFFYSPPQFNKIIQSPVPIVNVYKDLYNLGKAIVHSGEEVVTGEPVKGAKKNEFRKSAFKVFPVLSGFESLYSFIDEDYDKTNSKSIDSRGR